MTESSMCALIRLSSRCTSFNSDKLCVNDEPWTPTTDSKLFEPGTSLLDSSYVGEMCKKNQRQRKKWKFNKFNSTGAKNELLLYLLRIINRAQRTQTHFCHYVLLQLVPEENSLRKSKQETWKTPPTPRMTLIWKPHGADSLFLGSFSFLSTMLAWFNIYKGQQFKWNYHHTSFHRWRNYKQIRGDVFF